MHGGYYSAPHKFSMLVIQGQVLFVRVVLCEFVCCLCACLSVKVVALWRTCFSTLIPHKFIQIVPALEQVFTSLQLITNKYK